jgi:hypothetical protein
MDPIAQRSWYVLWTRSHRATVPMFPGYLFLSHAMDMLT